MNGIFEQISVCMKNGKDPASDEVQSLVGRLQNHITENYYHCSNDILTGLGQMYVLDERFKSNIDKQTEGTADFTCKAIQIYCNK